MVYERWSLVALERRARNEQHDHRSLDYGDYYYYFTTTLPSNVM